MSELLPRIAVQGTDAVRRHGDRRDALLRPRARCRDRLRERRCIPVDRALRAERCGQVVAPRGRRGQKACGRCRSSPVVVVFGAWSESPAAAIARGRRRRGRRRAHRLARARGRAGMRVPWRRLSPAGSGRGVLPLPPRRRCSRAGARRGAPRARRERTSSSLCARTRSRSSTGSRRRSRESSTTTSASTASPARVAARRSCRPLERWRELGGDPVVTEPALVEAVLDQVAAGRIRAGLGGSGQLEWDGGDERIEAPYLQLVMERLWEVERDERIVDPARRDARAARWRRPDRRCASRAGSGRSGACPAGGRLGPARAARDAIRDEDRPQGIRSGRLCGCVPVRGAERPRGARRATDSPPR